MASLIYILKTRTITLLNPGTWDDKNDSYFMEEYKKYICAKSVLALCFAEGTIETYHHWKIFSHGSDGICILFDKLGLEAAFANEENIKYRKVEYLLIEDAIKSKDLDVNLLPFMKRKAFKDEREYRIVYTDFKIAKECKHYRFELGSIRKIILSPWMASGVADQVKELLNSIDGCEKMRIQRSHLLDGSLWREIPKRFCDQQTRVAR